jgi:hypothetical protein
MSHIAELLSREEIMEKQRSRISWLKDGDRNTKLFQARSKERAKSNHIKALKSAERALITNQKDLEDLANDFYKELFSAQLELSVEDILDHVPVRVPAPTNDSAGCSLYNPGGGQGSGYDGGE